MLPLSAQVVPSAAEGKLLLAVGGGFFGYNVGWAHGHMQGGAIWADDYPGHLPPIFHGLGIEAEFNTSGLAETLRGQPSRPNRKRPGDMFGHVLAPKFYPVLAHV